MTEIETEKEDGNLTAKSSSGFAEKKKGAMWIS
ncbi:hypothetical protein A2U01_0080825 [Trifolium medium]|uniref:Uncharacterized protein n=1 Tax=Trifolium medium TaxID=97028 RepID=A0A392THA5_9FABA|nr:hypothetical protein [Trifolium medium]